MSRPSYPTHAASFPPGLVEQVLEDALASRFRPAVYAITGVPGSGKSTLATQLAQVGQRRGLRVVVLSIDDFYLTRRERQALAHTVHPLLATRGPPGTHDVALACRTLDRLTHFATGDSVALPRFDKIGDRRLPPSRWPLIKRAPDLLVFEGWFLKVPPESAAQLREPVNARERDEDKQGQWRTFCNDALSGYAPLWQRLDRLLWLHGPGFQTVARWRWQQEQTLQAANPGRAAMTRAQVERFVLLFERVSRQAERTLAHIADLSIILDARRGTQLVLPPLPPQEGTA